MSNVTTAAVADLWIGEVSDRRPSFWLAPLLVGLAAPVVAGMVLFPELLRDAVGIVALVLGVVLLVALGAYVVSVLAPGVPVALEARPGESVVAVVIRGAVAQREILVPFKNVAKLNNVKSCDHDGYEFSSVELKTRDGDTWVIPHEADDATLARLRSLIGVGIRRA